jgi:hypothetical protein
MALNEACRNQNGPHYRLNSTTLDSTHRNVKEKSEGTPEDKTKRWVPQAKFELTVPTAREKELSKLNCGRNISSNSLRSGWWEFKLIALSLTN